MCLFNVHLWATGVSGGKRGGPRCVTTEAMALLSMREMEYPLLEIELDSNTILRVKDANPAGRPGGKRIGRGKSYARWL
jgi:hypothetical protein